MALLARSARNALLESRSTLPPTFLLPLRARITTVSNNLSTGEVPEPLLQSGQRISDAAKERSQNALYTPPSNATKPANPSSPHALQNVVSKQITPSIRSMLPLLHSQPSHYMTIHLHGHPYLVTKGDTVRLPFLMPHVKPGDVLRLNRATHIGSRDYTLKAPEPIRGNADHGKKIFYLDDRLFTCRARVTAIESEPLRVEEKTKRRQRHVKHVKSKHRYTVLKISELEVKGLEEYEAAVRSN